MAGTGKRYLFTGGGTAGHVTPNLAVCDEIRHLEPEARFLYVGSRHGYEARVPEAGIPFRSVPCARFCSPRRPARFVWMGLRILAGILACLVTCLRFRPHVIVATGGFVSVPCVVAGWILRRRIYLHEQNAHPGLANRFLALFATRVGVSFAETCRSFPGNKAVHTGYPVRRGVHVGSAERARLEYGIPEGRRVALIFGGSMGARSINRGTVEALHILMKEDDLAIVHVTGLARTIEYDALGDTRMRLQRSGLEAELPGRYVCRPFISNMGDVYALADLVVARAGAGTVMELAAVGKPSILIPKSDAPGNHQALNALALQEAGAAEVLFEEPFEEDGRILTRVRGSDLAQRITGLLEQPDELRKMGQRARKLTLADALAVNTGWVRRLASDPSLLDRVTVEDRVGFLTNPRGRTLELLFRNNIVSSGLFADIDVPECKGDLRAVIQRTRHEGNTEFHLVPRRGEIVVNGESVRLRRRLEPEDRIVFGGQRFTFTTQERRIEREVPAGRLGLKVVVTGTGTLVSRMVGLARETLTASVLGAGLIADIWALGLEVSNYFRGVFAEMAVDTAFLPTFIHLERTGRRDAANRLFSSVLSAMLLTSGAVAVAAILTLPAWLPYIAPGFVDKGVMPEAVHLIRIMFPYLVLVSVAALVSAVLRAFDRFGVPAFSSIAFSLGIMGGLLFYPEFGLPALGIGLLVGGLGQILWQIPSLLSSEVRRGFGLRFTPTLGLGDPGMRKVAKITPNIFADVSVQKAGSVVDKILATSLASGAVAALHYSMVIFRLPYGLIAQSINTVLLKEVSEGAAVRDRDYQRRLLTGGLNWTVFTQLPVAVAMVILAEPMVRLVFEYNRFGPEDTARVAMALRCYAVGLVGWGVMGLCGRFFAARLEQGRATLLSLVALAINVGVSVGLYLAGFGIVGLAIGTSVSFLVGGFLRVWVLARSLAGEDVPIRRADLMPSLSQTALATAGSAVAIGVVYAAIKDFTGLPLVLNRMFVLGVPLVFGAGAFLMTAFLVRSEQLDEIVLRLGRSRDRNRSTSPHDRIVNPYCLGPERLLAWVRRNPHARLQHNLARRVTHFLRSADWKVRNAAVKLIGELNLTSFRYDLCNLVSCDEPAPWSSRLLGGDRKEPGFVRRNAVTALGSLGACDEMIARTLLDGLDDPYWEVRSEAARVLGVFAELLPPDEAARALAVLARRTRDRSFEVSMESVTALACLAEDDHVVPVLQRQHYHRNWQVRDRIVLAYRTLFERGILEDRHRLLALLDDVLTTSEGFVPYFRLKDDMQRLQRELLDGTDQKDEP